MKDAIFTHPKLIGLFLLWAVVMLGGVWIAQNASTLPLVQQVNDHDSLIRMVQVKNLEAGNGWYNRTIARDNYPHGMETHWSRLPDILLWSMAKLIQPFKGMFHTSLEVAATWFNPLLMLVAGLALLASVRPFAQTPIAQLYIVLALFLHPLVGQIFPAGKVDHHALQLTCFAVELALVMHLLTTSSRYVLSAVLLGVVAGLGIWAGVDFLLPAGLAMAALGLAWVFDKLPFAPLLHAMRGLIAVIAVAFLAEQPQADWWKVEYDTLSIAPLTLLAACWLAVELLARWQGRATNAKSRLLASGGAVVGAIAVTLTLFPDFWMGPLAAISPVMQEIFMPRISEAKPIYEIYDSYMVAAWLIGGVIGMIYLLRSRMEDTARWALIGGIVIFITLLFDTSRWYGYLVLLTIPSLALMIEALIGRLKSPPVFALMFMMVAAIYPYSFAVMSQAFGNAEKDPEHFSKACVAATNDALRRDYVSEIIGTKTQLVLVEPNFGPNVLYDTPHAILAWNNHRNAEGYSDAYHFMRAENEVEAKAIAKRRGAAFAMLCQPEPGFADRYPMLARLDKVTPEWMVPVEDHPWLKSGLKLYRLNF